MASRREVGSMRTVKNGPNVGMKFYGCPKWPVTDCEFFQWVNWNMDNSNVVNRDVEDVRFRLLEKDTIIGEKEIEISFMKETLKKVELKLESKDKELKDIKMELSCTRIELMKASRN
ncbi:DNA-(apurinic or apyrimidinic site) lyase 2 [Bienertia sinuspersici]